MHRLHARSFTSVLKYCLQHRSYYQYLGKPISEAKRTDFQIELPEAHDNFGKVVFEQIRRRLNDDTHPLCYIPGNITKLLLLESFFPVELASEDEVEECFGRFESVFDYERLGVDASYDSFAGVRRYGAARLMCNLDFNIQEKNDGCDFDFGIRGWAEERKRVGVVPMAAWRQQLGVSPKHGGTQNFQEKPFVASPKLPDWMLFDPVYIALVRLFLASATAVDWRAGAAARTVFADGGEVNGRWKVNTSAIVSRMSESTPADFGAGVHCDSYNLVALMLGTRRNEGGDKKIGGVNRFYKNRDGETYEDEPFFTHTMRVPFDLILLRDDKMWHEVSGKIEPGEDECCVDSKSGERFSERGIFFMAARPAQPTENWNDYADKATPYEAFSQFYGFLGDDERRLVQDEWRSLAEYVDMSDQGEMGSFYRAENELNWGEGYRNVERYVKEQEAKKSALLRQRSLVARKQRRG